MELGAHSPSFLISIRIQKGKETWSHTTFPRSGHFFQPWSKLYHQYADKLSWFAYKGIPTYPLIHKDKKNEKFAEAYSKAIKELEKDGTLAKLSKKYFGEDVFSYVDKEK